MLYYSLLIWAYHLVVEVTAVRRKQKADHKMKYPNTLFEKIRSTAMGSLQVRDNFL